MAEHRLAEIGFLKNSPDRRRPQRYARCVCGHVRIRIFESGERGIRLDFARHLENPERAPGAGPDAEL